MKVKTASEHLARIPMPKTDKEFKEAWEKVEQYRRWVDASSDTQVDKDSFDEAVSLKQEELETYWRLRRSA